MDMSSAGIAWASDVKFKFRNSPEGSTGQFFPPFAYERQAGCDAQQMYGNDSAVAEGLKHAYSLDLQLYAHARMLFCRALAGATSTTP